MLVTYVLGVIQRLVGSSAILMGQLMRFQFGQPVAFPGWRQLGWLEWRSSVPHISHPPACLDQACSHSDDRKAKELQRHIVPFRSRLRSGKTTTSGANASHKANFGLRSREIDSASLVREVLNHTTKGLIPNWDHQCNLSTTPRKPLLTPLSLLPWNYTWSPSLPPPPVWIPHVSLHPSSRFRIPGKYIRIVGTRWWSCTLKAQKHWESKYLRFCSLLGGDRFCLSPRPIRWGIPHT